MSDPASESTLPPRKPNTFRTWLPRFWAWLLDHPIFFAFVIGLVTGATLPKLLKALA